MRDNVAVIPTIALAALLAAGCATRQSDFKLEMEREVIESQPVITGVEVHPTGEIDTRGQGHEVRVAVIGDPGLEGSFDVVGRLKQQPLSEGPEGTYAGEFDVVQGDAGALQIEVTLRDPASGVAASRTINGPKLYRSEQQATAGGSARLPDCPRELAQELDRKLESVVVHYPLDVYELTEDAKAKMASLREAMLDARFAGCPIRVAGHSDEVGSEEYNVLLSRHRALEVAWFLEKRLGVPRERLQIEGYGESRPASPGLQNAAMNRRVELHTIVE